MAKYIDKAALVAEIKGYISNYKEIVAKTNRNDSTWVDSVSMIESKIGVLQHLLSFLDTLKVKDIQEKPVSEDLEEAANSCSSCIYLEEVLSDDDKEVLKERLVNTFKAGAEWKKEQFEKNRIEHCDSITEEQYNLETGFIDYYIDKYNRMPTFLDAIEYGMKKAMGE